MSIDVELVMRLIEDLDVPRFMGSEGERNAQELMASRLEDMGLKPRAMPFQGPWIEPVEATLTIGDETRQIFPVKRLLQWPTEEEWSPDWTKVRTKGRLIPREEHEWPTLEEVIVVHEQPEPEACRIEGAGAQLFLFDELVPAHAYVMAGDVPPAYIAKEDRSWLLSHLGDQAAVEWKTQCTERSFQNLMVEIPGASQEAVLLGAHLDTFPGTTGASDNAFGSALLLAIATMYSSEKSSRTLRLWWFTGEEVDKRGSQAAVEFEKVQKPTAKLLINIDGGVSRLKKHGEPTNVATTGGKNIVDWATQSLSSLKPKVEVREKYYETSDVRPFWQTGFLTACPGSTRQLQGGSPHLPTDNPTTVDPNRVKRLADVTLALVEAALVDPPPS